MADRLQVDYFSDVLCVWAWIAQRRLEEAEREWGADVDVRHRFVNVFGDTAEAIDNRWSDRGGFEGFAGHVAAAAAPYETAPVSADIWRKVRPRTSAMAHLVIKAADLVCGPAEASTLELKVREAFFVEAADIGTAGVVLDIASDTGIDRSDLESALDSGEALARVIEDYDRANAHGIRGSPSWVMNEGRQILYGNVGYRLISANIEELLKRPVGEASWC